MKVVCLLDDLLRELDMSDSTLANALKIDKRQILKLRRNQGWRLSKGAVDKLTLFAFRHGYEHGIFTVRPPDLWSTFVRRSAIIYRGLAATDAHVEAELTEYLEHLGCRRETHIVSREKAPNTKTIARVIATQNCVFVGTPKQNLATEIALSLLWGATPFDESRANRQKIPVQINGMPVSHPSGRSSLLTSSKRFGFQVTTPGELNPLLVGVTRKPADEYRTWSGFGSDAAVIVVRRLPVKNVTTIIVMGYTGMATHIATQELTQGEPPVTDDDLNDAGPHVLAYRFRFRKRSTLGSTHRGDPRRMIEGSGRWAPPWDNVTE